MIITALFAGFVCLAIYRRPDWVTGALMAGFVVSTVMGWTQPAMRLPGMLGGMDALLSVGMLLVWTHYHSQRARIVGTVALMKCAWGLVMSSGGLDWLAYAIVLNAAFVFQVIVAGGMADGLVAWLDRVDPFARRECRRSVDNLG